MECWVIPRWQDLVLKCSKGNLSCFGMIMLCCSPHLHGIPMCLYSHHKIFPLELYKKHYILQRLCLKHSTNHTSEVQLPEGTVPLLLCFSTCEFQIQVPLDNKIKACT